MLYHTAYPVYNENSRVLILGTFPSPKSREARFFYGHPQNRFWRVLASVTGCEIPLTVEEKTAMLLNNDIALWDVIASCDVNGADDASITNVTPNDLSVVLNTARIEKIFTNGGKAHALYKKYLLPQTGIQDKVLPSTSPANARWDLERLVEAWSVIKA